MGKADQKRAQNAITSGTERNLNNTNSGITEETARVNQLTPRSDSERSTIWNDYSGLANGGGRDSYLSGISSPAGGGGGSSSGGSSSGPSQPAAPAAEPDYLGVFRQLMGKEGGFDPTRLGNINDVANKLRDTSGNFGATDTSINGLQDFAKTGGLSADQLHNVNRDTLTEFEKTGGYDSGQLANIRSRSNAAVPAFYQNLKENMDRTRGVNNIGPGWDKAGFKLARQGAQDTGTQARDTEIGLADAVRSGRMDASKTLASNALATNAQQSQNTLSGYGTSGSLDIAKQGQISKDKEASGNLDLGTQSTINNARLGGASGISQDTLGRMQISSSAGASAAARADANARWAAEMEQRDKYAGNQGLLSLYQAAPTELMNNQNLLRDYRNDQRQAGNDEVNNRIGASRIPGLGSTISSGLNIAGQIAGIAGGPLGALAGGGGRPGNASVDDFRRYSGFGGYGTDDSGGVY